jgi:phosphoribosylamine--glycine ligase
MNILIIGSGGREHALADKLASSPLCTQLFISPGNAGTALLGQNLDIDVSDFTAVRTAVMANEIGLVVVGPEAPLVDGIVDYFSTDDQLKNIPIIGPSAEGALLEGSKAYAKEFMGRHHIPTAAYRSFEKGQLNDALDYLSNHVYPVVLKADGLAAGKGVLICQTKEEAQYEMREMLSGKFGSASATVVVEEFLSGIEFSVFALTDGSHYVLLPEAKDYKRIGEGDQGLNTGGMGAVSPVPFVDQEVHEKVVRQIIDPTIHGLKSENIPYKGFVFFGLILVHGDPYVIEYNCRLGDPETEAILPRLRSDLVELLNATWAGTMDKTSVEFDSRYAVSIILASGGYPESYEKGKVITGMDLVAGSRTYHAGTKEKDGHILTSGGRVMAITSLASTIEGAIEQSLINAETIQFEGKYFRRDIGKDLL